MQAIVVQQRGGVEVLQLRERPVPQPASGEVLLKIAQSGVNFADIMQHQGTYPISLPLPYTPGMECVGTLSALGEGVTGLSVGDRVGGITFRAGTYAEYVVLPAAQVFPLPDEVDDHSALALLIQGVTAYALLDYAAGLKAGETVLVHAAAGGVGNLAVQLARLLGAGTIFGTVGSAQKARLVGALGVDYPINYRQESWEEVILAQTRQQGVDVILDSVGGSALAGHLRCLAREGRLVSYGWLSGHCPALSPEQSQGMLFKNQSLTGFAVGIPLERHPERVKGMLGQLFGWFAEGKLRPVLGPRFALGQAKEAHAAVLRGDTSGKVVLTSGSATGSG
jgi:NADPH2:quinone reductase